MPPPKVINFSVDADGNGNVSAEGFSGGTCLEATADFERIFGEETGPRQMVGECAPVSHDKGERVR